MGEEEAVLEEPRYEMISVFTKIYTIRSVDKIYNNLPSSLLSINVVPI